MTPDQQPKPLRRWIYAYTTELDRTAKWNGNRLDGRGRIKIGETTGNVDARIKGQLGTGSSGGKEYTKILEEPAEKADGTPLRDIDIHKLLEKAGVSRPSEKKRGSREWFEITEKEAERAYHAARRGLTLDLQRDCYELRPEQEQAISKTTTTWKNTQSKKTKKFLWNAKMRFGKCFTALKLAKRIGAKRILILTYKPMVEDSWESEINTHVDFKGWKYIANDEEWNGNNTAHPTVVFRSYQKMQGEKYGPQRIRELKKENWNLLIIDEQHYGASQQEAREALQEWCKQIRVSHQLELSGTPFRDIEAGTFHHTEVFEWSYTDEQREKRNHENAATNPYKAMPRMRINAYQLSETLEEEITGEKEWTLSEMFRTKNERFVHEQTVAKWLETIQEKDKGKENARNYPYQQKPGGGEAEKAARHSVWVFGRVKQCNAMENLLEKTGGFFKSAKIVNASGGSQEFTGSGSKSALQAVRDAIRKNKRTITLTCGMLLTGVTVKEWGTILMLYDGKSATKYLQAAFRVQSPWEERGKILKNLCYVYEFDPNRMLLVLAEQADKVAKIKLNTSQQNEAAETVEFMDIVWHTGGQRQELNASKILQYASEGIGSRYLANRWNSNRMVNTRNIWQKTQGNANLHRILEKVKIHANPPKSGGIMIPLSENPKLAKKPRSRSQINQQETMNKEQQEIQKRLRKILASIPMFMYITPDREKSLLDLIEQTDETTFQNLTGITLKEFEQLKEEDAFNTEEMDKAVLHFRKVETESLGYLGAEPPTAEPLGSWTKSGTERKV